MTLPAAGTWDFQPFWAKSQGVRFKFAETWYNLFLHTAGRVMTLPYGCGAVNGNLPHTIDKRKFFARDDTGGYRESSFFHEFALFSKIILTKADNCCILELYG